MRHYRDTTYKGYYLRYNYETKSIDKMEMEFEKIDDSSTDDNICGIDLDDRTIILNDESGRENSFEFLDLIQYEDEEYIVLLPANGDDTEDEVVILQIEKGENDDEEEKYVSVDDEKTLLKVFEIFKSKFKDKFNFVD